MVNSRKVQNADDPTVRKGVMESTGRLFGGPAGRIDIDHDVTFVEFVAGWVTQVFSAEAQFASAFPGAAIVTFFTFLPNFVFIYLFVSILVNIIR